MARPVIFSLFKPPHISSYDLVRKTKRSLGELGERKVKLGHFGTLDPFASGLLLVGLHGASRLNNYIHEDLTKTYLAVGKLGIHTPTGDLTVEPSITDNSRYLHETIAHFDIPFLQEYLQKFVGKYMQAPHVYSAAKFQGRPLHQWAREGQEIHKPPVERTIYKIDIVKYSFPYFIFRCEVSSGTYVRTLFSDIAKELGTCGALLSLIREKIGTIEMQNGFYFNRNKVAELYDKATVPLVELLPYSQVSLPADRAKAFRNGLPVLIFQTTMLQQGSLDKYFWAFAEGTDYPIGLASIKDDRYQVAFNFPQ